MKPYGSKRSYDTEPRMKSGRALVKREGEDEVSEAFESLRCFFCKGPAHPATGHQVTPTVLGCLRCTQHWIKWYRARMHNPIALIAYADLQSRSLGHT